MDEDEFQKFLAQHNQSIIDNPVYTNKPRYPARNWRGSEIRVQTSEVSVKHLAVIEKQVELQDSPEE